MDVIALNKLINAEPNSERIWSDFEKVVRYMEQLSVCEHKKSFFQNEKTASTEVYRHSLEILNLLPEAEISENFTDKFAAAFILAVKNIYAHDVHFKMKELHGFAGKDIKILVKNEHDLFAKILAAGRFIPPYRTQAEIAEIEQANALQAIESAQSSQAFERPSFNSAKSCAMQKKLNDQTEFYKVVIGIIAEYSRSQELGGGASYINRPRIDVSRLNELFQSYSHAQFESIKKTEEHDAALAENFIVSFRTAMQAMRPNYINKPDVLNLLSRMSLSVSGSKVLDQGFAKTSQHLKTQLKQVFEATKKLGYKANELEQRGDSTKAIMARKLVEQIDSSVQTYFDMQTSLIALTGRPDQNLTKAFKLSTQKIISEVKPHLEKHADMGTSLANVLIAVASIGIVPIISKIFTGSFTVLQTQSALALRQVETNIEASLR
ncbi:MAG: hypothetical protein K0Q57_529 [Gammaproteobacteria bacterium]|nr:hypothetical protein [Gammaproteobacteria bacterium]